MIKLLTRGVLIVIIVVMGCVAAFAQKDKSEQSLACHDNWKNDKLVNSCEMREQTLPATDGTLNVDGRMNGGIAIKGWERKEILMRARVQTSGPTEAEAKELARQIQIESGGSKILASGPENRKDHWWTVSYEIFVPLHSDLSLKTNNGGISISDVNGRVNFTALNGGVSLKRVGGYVHGGTTNGGLSIELSGDRWDGEALDVSTTNGGVNMSIPENYSARLETGTVNGRVKVDFPVTVQGEISRELAVNLGAGGATIKAMTVNGGVSIHRGDGSRM
jgi:putative adhesin